MTPPGEKTNWLNLRFVLRSYVTAVTLLLGLVAPGVGPVNADETVPADVPRDARLQAVRTRPPRSGLMLDDFRLARVMLPFAGSR